MAGDSPGLKALSFMMLPISHDVLQNEQLMSVFTPRSLLMPFSSLGRECFDVLPVAQSYSSSSSLPGWPAVEAEHQSRFVISACMQIRDSSNGQRRKASLVSIVGKHCPIFTLSFHHHVVQRRQQTSCSSSLRCRDEDEQRRCSVIPSIQF